MRLGDLVKLYKGRKPLEIVNEPIEGYRRSLQISDLRPGAKPRYCPADRKELLAVPSDVIIAWDGANAGTTSHGLKGSVGSTLTVLRIQQKELVDTAYLGHFIASKQSYLRTKAKGATIPHLDRVILESLDVPLPPLEEQKRIVSILDKAKLIQEARERQLAALDELEYAIYNEIFADFPLEATLGYFKSQEVKPLPADYSPPSSHLVHKGDILFSRASGSLQLVGITCPVTYDLEDTYLPDKIWRVEATDPTKIDVRFVHYLLKSHAARAYIENMASGAAGVKNISKQKMKSLPCPVVPMEVQQIFLEKTIDINYLRSRIKESLRLSKNTAKNLLHEYIQRR